MGQKTAAICTVRDGPLWLFPVYHGESWAQRWRNGEVVTGRDYGVGGWVDGCAGLGRMGGEISTGPSSPLASSARGEETASRSAFQRKSHAVGEGQELARTLVRPCTVQASAPHLSLIPSRWRAQGDILSPKVGGEETCASRLRRTQRNLALGGGRRDLGRQRCYSPLPVLTGRGDRVSRRVSAQEPRGR